MKLSSIISAFDQHELTLVHVREAMNSTRCPDEIVVVNDHGDPSLLDMLKTLTPKCPIIYAYITTDITWNQNGARNLGLFLSTGDYIALEDNDHIPFRTFYEQALTLVPEYDRVMVKRRFVISREDLKKPFEEWKTIRSRGTARIISVNKRELLTDIKGFDEQFCGRYGWDVQDFRFRSAMRGVKETAIGNYFVVNDWLSNLENRRFYPESAISKMDVTNAHHVKRNVRNKWVQSPIGMLNFQYTVTRLC